MINIKQQVNSLITFKLSTLILITLMLITLQVSAASVSKKILMVVSGYGQEEKSAGYEFDEFSKAYLVFKANGISVDIASPKGGKVTASKYDATAAYNAKTLADKNIMDKLAQTLATSDIDASKYSGIFIVGGKGAMFDLPKDKALKTLIADIYQQQGTVAAVCHGPAALVDVKLNDGSYLVANKAINGFTNTEEQLFGKKWLSKFDFMLEDKLIERGGKFQSSDIMLSHVAIDDRLITGQNPSSTVGVANALVSSLGIKPVLTEQYQDDKTLALVAKLLAGDKSVLNTLSENQQDYHLALVGMYGFYYAKIAENNLQISNALSLMIAAQAEINNPMLDMKIAKAQQQLGNSEKAKTTLAQLLLAKPDYQPAKDMLKTL
ncbi:type 1 glutamine amidotransferase domain-containing protein [Colwellia psychrerythraea]|uniref:ThiJ/PfpI domain-containing protein n=1 Tax=Colwellia psychrerythraea TaxID=28229 RepID=A0A099L5C2_COLPS|nr:type 1 glutamine amidotransferase domain-containing protein [Colwellia psychrerythraea]KGJ97387.1 ThiJ/PfpI domain-containing protein [Colwellia psychrerythraea]